MLPGIGVCGTGSQARALIPILQSVGFRVVAVWGQTAERAEKLASEMGVAYHTQRVDDFLLHADVDLVCISSPPLFHSQVAVKALSIGKHVMCQQPAGLDAGHAFKMLHAALYYPSLMCLMSHGLRFLPACLKMKSLISQGDLGTVQLCEVKVQCGSLLKEHYNWMCDRTMGGGALNTIGSHLVDIISFLTDQRAKRAQGLLRTFTRQTERIHGIRTISSDDYCAFHLELVGGAFASVSVNTRLGPAFHQEVTVLGSKGRLTLRNAELFGQGQGSGPAARKEELLLADIQRTAEFQRAGVGGALDWLPPPYLKGQVKMMGAVQEAFARKEDRLNWDPEPLKMAATFEDALYVQTVLDAVRRSSSEGGWQHVLVRTEEDPSDSHHQPIELSAAGMAAESF